MMAFLCLGRSTSDRSSVSINLALRPRPIAEAVALQLGHHEPAQPSGPTGHENVLNRHLRALVPMR
jgi:hypothetical protein